MHQEWIGVKSLCSFKTIRTKAGGNEMLPYSMIEFAVGERYSLRYLKKRLGAYHQDAIDKGYFKLINGKGEEPIYIFTLKGRDEAWSKK